MDFEEPADKMRPEAGTGTVLKYRDMLVSKLRLPLSRALVRFSAHYWC